MSRHGMVSADAAHVQRLQRALQQRNSELQLLNNKLEKIKRDTVNLPALCPSILPSSLSLPSLLPSPPSLSTHLLTGHAQVPMVASEQTQKYAEAFVQFGDKKEYIAFLELQLRQSQ